MSSILFIIIIITSWIKQSYCFESYLNQMINELIRESQFSITPIESVTFLVDEDYEKEDFWRSIGVPTSIGESSSQIGKYCQEGALLVQLDRQQNPSLLRIVENSQRQEDNKRCLCG